MWRKQEVCLLVVTGKGFFPLFMLLNQFSNKFVFSPEVLSSNFEGFRRILHLTADSLLHTCSSFLLASLPGNACCKFSLSSSLQSWRLSGKGPWAFGIFPQFIHSYQFTTFCLESVPSLCCCLCFRAEQDVFLRWGGSEWV